MGLIRLHKNVRLIGICMYIHNYMHTKYNKESSNLFCKKMKKVSDE